MNHSIAAKALVCITLFIAGSASAVLNNLEDREGISQQENIDSKITIYHLNTHWVTGSSEYANDGDLWNHRVAFIADKVLAAEAE